MRRRRRVGIVTTIPEKCKRCYTCIRECPAKAIKVENGQAMVIEERCIACGNCVKVCAQKAKHIEDGLEAVRRLLAERSMVVACLAPSFPAAFTPRSPATVVAAVRSLGFREVWEVAFGAELISREYAQKVGASEGPLISTPCPAIVAYVEKYLPSLRGALAPIVSPMIAVARAVKLRHGKSAAVVFIGPCVAKKAEIRDPNVAGEVDAVLTYEELQELFGEREVDFSRLEDDRFDSPPCMLGAAFPISGGLLETAGLDCNILDNQILTTEGKERVLAVLHELAENRSEARFLDLLFCEGCINGPKMLNDLSVFKRKEILADYVNRRRATYSPEEAKRMPDRYRAVDLSREFSTDPITLRDPTEEEIAEALKLMDKEREEDQLNCGACGYLTCREKAVAVCQGLAEPEMCLPYMLERLEATCSSLEQSHRELADAQARLVQTEKLASMGQVSAGIAHEINNPLGTILLYAHLLLERIRGQSEERRDLETIAREADRCRRIMRGLLDFARHSRISRSSAAVGDVVREVLDIMELTAGQAAVELRRNVEEGLPEVMIDADQIKQMLINLVQNGIDAVQEGGTVTVGARLDASERAIILAVEDNGKGIPEENLGRLFTPFFTTKGEGKGTGLGLAIAYGVVKMHSGDIAVESEAGRGTRFSVALPLAQAEEPCAAGVTAGGEP